MITARKCCYCLEAEMEYDIVKAVRQIAIALIFIMINLNVEFTAMRVNFVPSFIGFYLVYMVAHVLFEGPKLSFMKNVCLACFFFSLMDWIFGLMNAQLGYVGFGIRIAEFICNVIFMVLLFNRLYHLAAEAELDEYADTFRSIMIIYIIVYVGFYLTSMLLGSRFIVAALGILIYAMIAYTLVTVFRFARILQRKSEEE